MGTFPSLPNVLINIASQSRLLKNKWLILPGITHHLDWRS